MGGSTSVFGSCGPHRSSIPLTVNLSRVVCPPFLLTVALPSVCHLSNRHFYIKVRGNAIIFQHEQC